VELALYITASAKKEIKDLNLWSWIAFVFCVDLSNLMLEPFTLP